MLARSEVLVSLPCRLLADAFGVAVAEAGKMS